MNTVINEIKKKKGICIFVSPHLDDAIFSCGALLHALKKENIKTSVVTVFTKAYKKNSFSAKAYLKMCNSKDGVSLYKKRKKEDIKALENLSKPVHLGMTEALWRRKSSENVFSQLIPELSLIYPTYRWHVAKGNVVLADEKTMAQLKKKLEHIINGKRNVWIFCPLGVGNHVDHILVRDVCKNLHLPVIYWADYPYSKKVKPDLDYLKHNNLHTFTFTRYKKEKEERMHRYKTQIHAFQPIINKTELEEFYFTTI